MGSRRRGTGSAISTRAPHRSLLATWCWLCLFCLACPAAEGAVDEYLGKPIASVKLLIEGRETIEPSIVRVVETRR